MDTTTTTVVFVGPGASGKDYATNELCTHHGYTKCVSTTTRQPREGEEKGHAYDFVSRNEFEAGLAADEYLEHDEFVATTMASPTTRFETGTEF
jgi:guanylate kinase